MKVFSVIQMLFLTSMASYRVKCPSFCECESKKAVCKGYEATYIPKLPQQITSLMMLSSELISLDEHSLLNLTLNPRVKTLSLFANGIVTILPNAFSKISSLSKVVVQYEGRLKINSLMAALARMNRPLLKTLTLADNLWHDLPGDMFSQFINTSIENLHLTGNKLYHLNSSIFSPLIKLKTLDLSFNAIETIDIVGINNLISLILDYNNLVSIPQFCSTNKSKTSRVENLNFNHNHIVIIESSSLNCLKSLKVLLLDDNHLRGIDNNTFANLQNLTSLSIKKASFPTMNIQHRAFNSSSLEILDLSINDLRPIEHRLGIMLKPLKKLKKLIMTDAQLTQIPIDELTELSTCLSRLDLSLNPFSCTCEQMGFRNWIHDRSIQLLSYPRFYKCESPHNMKGVLLDDYRPTIKSCTPWNPLFTIIVIVSSTCVFVLFIIGIVCRCQTNIKNRLYLFRVKLNKRTAYSQLENTNDCEYHAFVVYCEADSKWVHTEFLKRMEIEEGMRLCVHHRDFDVGEAITNNIDRYLQRSLKVVVVMSNNFAKSDWCQWEIDVVQERRRRQGKNAFLLIMLKNIDSKHMTSSLRTLLESTPHLTYQTGIGGKLFWKAAIETLRRPLGHPPTAVL